VRGKFVYSGEEKFYVRGVTYGTFRSNGDNGDYPDPAIVERDFREMAASGVNVIRTYTAPPRWLLDLALACGLRVMVGLPWEQHIAFLDDSARGKQIEERVRSGARACAGHPAVLCYAVGNEIPASIVRWHGRRRIERFIRRIYDVAKSEDPDGLVTYVNYPSTEYLRLPFLDLVCFNVFLEDEEQLEVYVARLQNIAGNRPLIIAELGLDSDRHGEEAQAVSLGWQIRTAFRSGCAGAVVFCWTDEWHTGGLDIAEWQFGLTDRHRRPKAALTAVREAFDEAPFPKHVDWPPVSVVVCTYNGSATLRECLEGIEELDYPDYEAIVVDDGSTDASAAIAEEYDVRLIRTENRGLSAARNTGLEAASGEIVAYIDDDTRPDRHWLRYIAAALTGTSHAGVGGPNVAPPTPDLVSECVDLTPGGPMHVLLSDREAEHIPGCNMAFRRAALVEIGGFDPQFHVAGDDVDICWRLRDAGWTLGFSPGAMVWHRRRSSIRAFLRQQRQYGRAEALLERKWPERYNMAGHVAWAGRVYGGALGGIGRRPRIYYGTWGAGLFQSADPARPSLVAALPLLPEWYLVVLGLSACSILGVLWRPLLVAVPLLALAVGLLLVHASAAGARASLSRPGTGRLTQLKRRALTQLLHLLQPLARLSGRMGHGLTPWRRRTRATRPAVPRRQERTIWSETWQAPAIWLTSLESSFKTQSSDVRRGGDYDRWDLQVRGGSLGAARVRVAVEEHGQGRQLLRHRLWPRLSPVAVAVVAVLAVLALLAAIGGPWYVSAILGGLAVAVAFRMLHECAVATDVCLSGIDAQIAEPESLGSALEHQLRFAKTAAAYAQERGDA
jgi:GT2 family glycosyltransferase/membrane protein implicated in regulation of membrane protease activity